MIVRTELNITDPLAVSAADQTPAKGLNCVEYRLRTGDRFRQKPKDHQAISAAPVRHPFFIFFLFGNAKREGFAYLLSIWCGRRDLNPDDRSRGILSPCNRRIPAFREIPEKSVNY